MIFYIKAVHNTIRKELVTMKKMDELMTTLKLDELLNKRDNEKKKNTLLWVLAIVGAVAAIAGIAYAVYRFVCPACPGMDDDFEDDFE